MSPLPSHQEPLKQAAIDFRNNANEASIPLQSYDCGFLRGIATIALSGAKGSVVPQVPNSNNVAAKQAIA